MPQANILVVADSPTQMKLATSCLESQGDHLITAMDGEEALQKASREQPDLIVLDVILPRPNGFQVCRALKTSDSTKTIPVIMLTSKNQDSDKFWGLRQGADAYLPKPFAEAERLTTVAQHL